MEISTSQMLLSIGGSLAGAIIGGLASLAAALLTFRHEARKFARERLWDARREAYTALVAGLAALETQTAMIRREFGHESGEESYFGGPRFRADLKKLGEMQDMFRDTFTHGRLVLSDPVSEEASALICAMEQTENDPNLGPTEIFEKLAESVRLAAHALLRKTQGEIMSP